MDSLTSNDDDGTNEGVSPLPCLNSNISIENAQKGTSKLSTSHRKTAFILQGSIESLAQRYGVEHLGFLTLTFADHVTCHKEAQRRLNSLITNEIKSRYFEYVGVMERQKSGRIHYHFLVVLKHDIRTGVDFELFSKGDYKTASKALRDEWFYWRKTARKYRFGRTELLPVKSGIEAMSKYVGKYVSKHIEQRLDEDKGARLVRYSRGARIGTTRFMFNTSGAELWRKKVAVFCQMVNENRKDVFVHDMDSLAKVYGKKWAYKFRDFILSLPVQ